MAEGLRRIQRRQDTSTPLPTVISGPPTGSTTATGIASATGIVSATGTLTDLTFVANGSTRIQSGVVSSTSEPSATTTAHTSATSSNARGSTTAAAQANTTNMSTLIPAIVAPIAAVLIISFISFWVIMRRRTKKALQQEPEFVMEGMKEKPRDRPPTADSSSSTQELVPNRNKEAAINVKEVDQSIPVLPPINRDAPFAPPRLESAMDNRPDSRQGDQNGKPKAVPNFSRGPRPNTGSRDITPSPVPGFAQMPQQERGESRSGQYPPLVGAPGQRQEAGMYGQDRGDPSSRPMGRPVHPRHGSFSRPLGPPPPGVTRGPPAPISTGPNRPSQEGRSHQVQPGAYNGSSPISQYSPIVKDIPKFGTSPAATKPNAQARAAGGSISSINDQGNRKPPPSAIKTNSPQLPPTDSTFSNEHVRTAPLANNSTRLGFHSMVATTAATSPSTEEPPTPSPRLPPPATRDAPPTNYNIPLPTHEPPAPASIQARLNGASISDRRSVVSGLSDDYVDVEVDDAKSDVSSLDEREKWQMQSDTERANSRQAGLGGYGGLSPRPPLLSSESNSEGSDSQYSLGYYSKDHVANDKR